MASLGEAFDFMQKRGEMRFIQMTFYASNLQAKGLLTREGPHRSCRGIVHECLGQHCRWLRERLVLQLVR